MDYIGHDSIANVILKKIPEHLQHKTLAESRLKQEHSILVLLVERDGFKPEAAVAGTVFRPGDRLTVFGRYDEISRVFQAEERFF
jgi:Trk K+ transport system NAD-binding subunit